MTSREASDMTALADRLVQVAKVMRSARREHRNMSVWPDDLKAVEDAEAALRHTAARPDAGYAVKALEWRDHRPDSFPEPAWSAQTPFGFYNIEEVSASDSPAYVARLHAHHFIADKDSLDEAKAAAQADYEKRIRSALLEQPATPGYAAGFEACRDAAKRAALSAARQAEWAELPDAAIDAPTRSMQKVIAIAISALPAPAPVASEVTGWQPIETAPRDGTDIVVYRPNFDGNYIPQVGTDYWMTKGVLIASWGRSRSDCQPTHWQPFPTPPITAKAKEGK